MSGEAGLQGEVTAIITRLRQLNSQLRTAKTPAELTDLTQRMKLVSRGLGDAGDRWVGDTLPRSFQETYRATGGSGAIPKRYTDASYRNRKKARQSFAKLERRTGLWVDTQGRQAQITKGIEVLGRQSRSLAPTEENKALKNDLLAQIDKLQKQSARLPKEDDGPMVAIFNRKGRNKSKVRGFAGAERFTKMISDYHDRVNDNLAVIGAAEKNGSGFVIVRDGSDCGLTSHQDPDKVNGQVWPTEKAFKYPSAHPNCERSFVGADGPPGGDKVKSQLAKLFGTAATTAKVVKGASTIGKELLANPFVSRYARELLDDQAFNPPPFITNYLKKISSYEGRVAKAWEQHGARLGVQSPENMRDFITGSLDDMFGTEEFIRRGVLEKVSLTAEQSVALNLPRDVSKGQLLSRMDDYGDWLAHDRAMKQELGERITHLRVVSGAQDEVRRIAALRFDMTAPEGLNARRNWYRAIQDIKKTYDRDPDKANIDAIRLLARTFDPSPWLRATAGKFKFSIGMPADGRADLAEKLFVRLSKTTRWSEQELRWAKELGMDLTSLPNTDFTRRDIIEALIPRITHDPGGMFSSSVGLINGKLQPILRVYPHSTLGRLFDLETHLRSGAVEDFLTTLRKSEAATQALRVKEALNGLEEDTLTTLRFWRNGPVGAAMRFSGTSAERLGFYIKPESGWMRYSYSFYSDEEQVRLITNRSLAEVHDLADALGVVYKDDWTRAEIARKIVRLKGPLEINSWREGLVMMPQLGSTFQVLGIDEAAIVSRMIQYKGNVLEAARSLRMDYSEVSEWWAGIKSQYQDLWVSVGDNELLNARSWDDVKRILETPRREASRLGKADMLEHLSDATRGVDPYLIKQRELMEDIARTKRLIQAEFPNLKLPEFEMAVDGPPLEYLDGVVRIRKDLADDWALAGRLRSKAVKVGHFPADTADNAGSLIHEVIHSTVDGWSSRKKANIMFRLMDELNWSNVPGIDLNTMKYAGFQFQQQWFRHPIIKKQIGRRLSRYATEDFDELVAEALVEYLTAAQPRQLASVIANEFREQLI